MKILSFARRRNAAARAERAGILRQRHAYVTRFFHLVLDDPTMDRIRFCQLLVRMARRGSYSVADVRAAMALLEPRQMPDYGRAPHQHDLDLEPGRRRSVNIEDSQS